MIKAIAFDFDGVIVESVDVKTRAFAKLFEHEGIDIVNKVVDYHLQNGGISRYEKFRYYYQHLLKRTLTTKEEAELGVTFSRYVLEEVINAEWIPGAKEAIESLHKKVPLFIVSGTPEDELKYIVGKKGIQSYFSGVYGAPAKKDEILSGIISKMEVMPSEIIMIGDSKSDYIAAVETGVHFIGINGSNGLLGELNCRKLKDLIKLDEEINNFGMQIGEFVI